MKLQRILYCILAVAALFLALAGCQKSPADSSGTRLKPGDAGYGRQVIEQQRAKTAPSGATAPAGTNTPPAGGATARDRDPATGKLIIRHDRPLPPLPENAPTELKRQRKARDAGKLPD